MDGGCLPQISLCCLLVLAVLLVVQMLKSERVMPQ